MRHTTLASLLLALTLFAPSALASDDGPFQHKGFYLRLTTGIGYSTSSETVSGTEIEFSGLSGVTTIGIGWAVIEDLIVNLDIFGAVPQEPTVKIGGKEIGESKAEITIMGVGPGVTYYVMPINVYIGAAVGGAKVQVKTSGVEAETDWGWGVNLVAGKEWWVSDNWGLGVAAQVLHTSVPDKGSDGKTADLSTTAGGVLFTATYN